MTTFLRTLAAKAAMLTICLPFILGSCGSIGALVSEQRSFETSNTFDVIKGKSQYYTTVRETATASGYEIRSINTDSRAATLVLRCTTVR